jgi:4-amino-4-deoxy-L-arabinose transferase-like glycosyltransferase
MIDSGRLQRVIVACVLIVVAAVSLSKISGSIVANDAAQNLLMAVNLSHHDVISLDQSPPYKPTMYREPAPVVVNSLAVDASDLLLGRAEAGAYFSGSRARLIKDQNTIWMCLLWLGVFGVTRLFTGSFWAALLAACIALRPFLNDTHVNNLTTELLAGVFLMFGTLALVCGVARRSVVLIALAGLLVGMFALCKAAGMYVAAGLVLVLLLRATYGPEAVSLRRRAGIAAVLAVCSAGVVAPWLFRNVVNFGVFQIAERGGLAVYTRALLNQMSSVEFEGTFFAWARPGLQPAIGRLLGFTESDLSLGGRLQRLNERIGSDVDKVGGAAEDAGRPEAAVSFWRQGRAKREALETQLQEQGVRYPSIVADRMMQKDGLKRIVGAPLSSLKLTVPLLWRAGISTTIILVAAVIYALRARRYLLLTALTPAVILLGLYGLATDFLPRYAVLCQPTAVSALVVVVYALWRQTVAQRGALSGGFSPETRTRSH